MIYKLLDREAWTEAEAEGRFIGSPVDQADGFIHFSSAAQVRETARKHFKGVADLLILAVDPEALGAPLVWEPSRGGDLFPHLYAPMPTAAVRGVATVALDADGAPVIESLP